MDQRWVWSFVSVLLLLVPTACAEQTANPMAAPTSAPRMAVPPATTAGVLTTAPKGALTCPPATALPPNVPLAARVNGQGISLDLFNRQVMQAQAALVRQGLDPREASAGGEEALKSLRQQVLEQMIDDVVISQQAEKERIGVSDNDLNARLAQMIQDNGSTDKLNDYLVKSQLSLAELCNQVRSHWVGEGMLNRVTGALPTQVEQVHARHILVSSPRLAEEIVEKTRAGQDFATLAKQYSMDEASKANGGDRGWFPRGVMDPQFEAIAFQLKPGQISDVVQTQFGFHIIKVEEYDNARPLPPELIQNARQQAFLAWLQAVRGTMKIERLVQP